MNRKYLNQTKGITLIALVITIIVLLILAGISISMLTGENGLLTKASSAKTATGHAGVLEQIQLQASSYTLEKMTGDYSGTLIDYLGNKSIISEITGETGKWKINISNLLGSNQSMGNGTYPNDVYVLEEEISSGRNIINKKVATTGSVKIAATGTSKTYDVIYYGKNASDFELLGSVVDGGTGSNLGTIEERLKAYFNSEEGFNGEDNNELGIKVEDINSLGGDNTENEGYDYFLYKDIIYKMTYVLVPTSECVSVGRITDTDLITLGEQVVSSENMYYLKGNKRDIDFNRAFSGNAYRTIIHYDNGRRALYYNESGEVLHILKVTGPKTYDNSDYLFYVGEDGHLDYGRPFLEEGYYSEDTRCYYNDSGIYVNIEKGDL